MKKIAIFIFLSLAAGSTSIATPWRGLFFEEKVCLRASPEAPINKPKQKNNCPSYIYKALAIIPERKKLISLLGKNYRKTGPEDQAATNFFGKNKFSSTLTRIKRPRKF